MSSVTEPIDAFTKLKFRGAVPAPLTRRRAISYVRGPQYAEQYWAVLEVMKFIYDNIIYAELNTKSDYCQVCGWDGEIEIVEGGRQAHLEVSPVRHADQGIR